MQQGAYKKIGVFGHYGNCNLGDEAIIEAVIANCRQRHPQARIICFSVDPADTAERHGVTAFGIRPVGWHWSAFPSWRALRTGHAGQQGAKAALKRYLPALFYLLKIVQWLLQLPFRVVEQSAFVVKTYGRVRQLDVLLVSGSNQFLDNFGGAWGFPWTLLLWTLLAKLSGTKIAFLSVGAGPVSLRLSKIFIARVLKKADYYSFRDVGSVALVAGFMPEVEPNVFPDLAFSLPVAASPATNSATGSATLVVGINPMPVYDPRYWPVADAMKYRQYVDKVVEFSTWLLGEGHRIRFFSTQPKDGNVIEDIKAQLLERCPQSAGDVQVLQHDTTRELLRNLADLDAVVATRFHGVLLALLMNKPVAAICYGRKTFDLMDDCRLGDLACGLDEFSAEDLRRCFIALAARAARIRTALAGRTQEYRRRLQEQYDRVLGRIRAGTE